MFPILRGEREICQAKLTSQPLNRNVEQNLIKSNVWVVDEFLTAICNICHDLQDWSTSFFINQNKFVKVQSLNFKHLMTRKPKHDINHFQDAAEHIYVSNHSSSMSFINGSSSTCVPSNPRPQTPPYNCQWRQNCDKKEKALFVIIHS